MASLKQKIKERIKDRLENPDAPAQEEEDTTPAAPTGFSLEQDQGPFDTAVALFIHIRTEIDRRIDEFVASMLKISEQKQQVEGLIASLLEKNGQDSARSKHGTAYLGTRRTCTLEDKEAFMSFVIENQLFDLIERRGAAVAIDDYAQEHNGQLPPGCKLNKVQTVNVRKA